MAQRFPPSAPRQESDHPLGRVEPMPRQERFSFRFDRCQVTQRVSHKSRIDATLDEVLFLKGKYREQVVDHPANLANPPPSPCPDLWRNVIHHRHSQALQTGCDSEMEVWCIRENCQCGARVLCGRDQPPEQPVYPRDMPQDLEQADDGDVFRAHDRLHPRFSHARSGATEEPGLRKLRLQGQYQARRVTIAGGLTG